MLYQNTLTYKLLIALAIVPMLLGLIFVTVVGFAVFYIIFAVMISKVFIDIAIDKYKARQARKIVEVTD